MSEFSERVEEQAKANVAKYGKQDPLVLLQVAQIQMGHVFECFFKGDGQLKTEIIHTAAVLHELYRSGK